MKDKQLACRTLIALRGVATKIAGALGLFELDPAEWLLARRDRQVIAKGIDRKRVEEMVTARDAARALKTKEGYAESDRIRAEASSLGIEMMDSPTGTTWKIAKPVVDSAATTRSWKVDP